MVVNIRFVLVGSGNIASTYVRAIDKCSGMTVVGVVSRSGRLPDAPFADPAAIEVKPSLNEIDAEFDAVIITTPNALHHVSAIEAAELNKHVLTEKVLDTSVENMDAMIAACRRAKVKLGVTYQRRMSPDNQVMKKVLSDGALGRVFAADLSVKFYRDQAYYDSAAYRGTYSIDGGGPFMQQAAHNIDIYTWFFGKPRKVVSALGTFLHEIEAEDHGVALLQHEDGMIGTITASTSCYPGFPGRMAIHAEKGTVILENDVIKEWYVPGLGNPSRAHELAVHSGAGSAAVADTGGHELILKDFVQAIRDDREPAITADSARLSTELILDIYSRK